MRAVQSWSEVFKPRIFIKTAGGLAEDISSRLKKFEYEDHDNKMDRAEIVLVNENLRFLDDPRFLEGGTIDIVWGYPGNWSSVRTFRFMKAKPDFPESGQPTFTIVCFDMREGMNRVAQPKNWGSVNSSDIAKVIAKRYKLDAQIEPSHDARKENRTQAANTTDIEFLMKQAAKINYECYVTENTLVYRPIKYDGTPELEYTWYTDPVSTFLTFSPEVNLTKPPAMGVSGADAKNGDGTAKAAPGPVRYREFTAVQGQWTGTRWLDAQQKAALLAQRLKRVTDGGQTAPPTAGPLNTSKSLTSSNMEAIGQNADGSIIYAPVMPITHASPETNPKVIAGQAKALTEKLNEKAVKSDMSVIGTPRLRAKMLIYLRGLGSTYSGVWRVAGTKHTIDDSKYVTTLQLTKSGVPAGADAAGAEATKKAGAKNPSSITMRAYSAVSSQWTGNVTKPAGPKATSTP